VQSRDLQRRMYELHDASMAQRILLAGIGAVCVGIAWWLLFGGGLETSGGWLGRIWKPGDVARRGSLAAALSVYYVRILFTEFVFLKRGVSWSEVFTIAPWMSCIYLVLEISGGMNPRPVGVAAITGMFLFVVGSWMNSYAEYTRHRWKGRPENHGRLYTQGLFRCSRHPNYFGDLISFSGICLITGALVTAVIPVLMLAGFVFVNIPVLDSHLHDHYGPSFDDYAAHARKLIPFVY
jgi:protein-S-isoprenylcysteine O-methyltransferase Ste14